MKQRQMKKPGHDGHKYMIIITESGEMHLEMMDDGVRAMARKLLGTNTVDTVGCGIDKRFSLLYAPNAAADRYNQAASKLAQEYIMGPVAVVKGDAPDRLHGMSRYEGKKVLDLSEAPQAYKDIEDVIASERDLVEVQVRLTPLAVLKG